MTQGKLAQLYRKALGYSRRDFRACDNDDGTAHCVADSGSGGVIADLRQDRDHWREQAQRLALLAPKPVEHPPATPIEREGNGFMRACRRMRSTG